MATVVLVQAWPLDADTGAEVAVRLAGMGSRAYTQLGFTDWRGGVANVPRYTTELKFEQAGWTGGAVPTTGAIRFFPSDLSLLTALAGHAWRDARISVTIGDDETAVYGAATLGKVAGASVDDGALTITFSDLSGDLVSVVCPDTFAGTGGIEGGTDATGRVKRRTWGYAFNIEGRLLVSSENIYEFGDPARPLSEFVAVRDKGMVGPVAILGWQGSIGDTLAALITSDPPDGGAVVAPSIACVKWWTQPSGPLTADIRGEVGTGYVQTAPEIAARIATTFSTTITVSNLSEALTWQSGIAGIHAENTNETAGQLLDRLLAPLSLIWVLSPVGALSFRRWFWGTATETLRSESVGRETIYAPLKNRIVGYKHNYRQHSDAEISAALYADDVFYSDGSTVEELKPAAPGATNGADPSSPFGSGGLTVGAYQSIVDSVVSTSVVLEQRADDLESRIYLAEGTIVTQGTTIANQGAQISANATAIDSIEGQLADLTISVRAGSNLLGNSSFENGLVGWGTYNSAGVGWTVTDGYAGWGPFAFNNGWTNSTSSTAYAFVEKEYAGSGLLPGLQMTMSMDGALSVTGGAAFIYPELIFYNGAAVLQVVSGVGFAASFDFSLDPSRREALCVTAAIPANTTRILCRAVIAAVPGVTVTSSAIRQVKLERGDKVTAYTQEASVSQAFKAISSTNLDVASLTSEVATQGASITTNATAISTLNSNYATLSSTVSTQGSSITTNASAISTLNTNYASLSSTVSAQGATVTATASAVSDIQSGLAASYQIRLDTNGRVAYVYAFNNGAQTGLDFNFDTVRFLSSAGTSRAEIRSGTFFCYNSSVKTVQLGDLGIS